MDHPYEETKQHSDMALPERGHQWPNRSPSSSDISQLEKAYQASEDDLTEASSMSEAFDINWTLKLPGTGLESSVASSSSSIAPVPSSEKHQTDADFPPEHANRVYRFLRWKFFSTYRRLFVIVFLVNISVLAAILSMSRLSSSHTLTAVSINLAISIIIRDQTIVDLLFLASCSLPLSMPLWLRCWAAKIYSYGGLHSGCAFAATIWYIFYAIYNFIDTVQQSHFSSTAIWITTLNFLILLLLLIMILLAYPSLRARFHNTFESTHRYAGWTVLALFWALCILHATSTSHTTSTPLGTTLLHTPTFYCLILITTCLLHPWLQVRKHPITRIEPLSPHAIRLHFSHASPSHCTTVRVSDNLLKESHAFACIPYAPCIPISSDSTLAQTRIALTTSSTTALAAPPIEPGFSLLISRAGDWTSRLIDAATCPTPTTKAPTHLTFKARPTLGVLRVATLFRSIVLMATGSGIGPCLSLIIGCPNLRCRVIWTTPGPPADVFGEEAVETVRRADPGAIISNTREEGRPDLVRLSWGRYMEDHGHGRAEAVFLISNAKITESVVYGLECRGVPAFAPIFDS